ncbi:unnamed protein product [Ambrosiozyma monospora]|uniref:Unnamed protein product n=1 Tax=Ambrosiozyma monospora TaxID=43982 RepID=A0A9W6YU84_AMBMO|nr:unnamed protein product [Ambrosiozyma monospora]
MGLRLDSCSEQTKYSSRWLQKTEQTKYLSGWLQKTKQTKYSSRGLQKTEQNLAIKQRTDPSKWFSNFPTSFFSSTNQQQIVSQLTYSYLSKGKFSHYLIIFNYSTSFKMSPKSYKSILKAHPESKSKAIKTSKTVHFTSDTKTKDALFNKSTTKMLPFMTKSEVSYRYLRSENVKLNNEHLKSIDSPECENMYVDVKEEFKDRDSKNLSAQVSDVLYYRETSGCVNPKAKLSQQALVDSINALMISKLGYETVEEAVEAGCKLAKLVVDAEKVTAKQQKKITSYRRRRQIRRYNRLCQRELDVFEKQAATKVKFQCKMKREDSIHKKRDVTMRKKLDAGKKEKEEREAAKKEKEEREAAKRKKEEVAEKKEVEEKKQKEKEEGQKKQNRQYWSWFSGFFEKQKTCEVKTNTMIMKLSRTNNSFNRISTKLSIQDS